MKKPYSHGPEEDAYGRDLGIPAPPLGRDDNAHENQRCKQYLRQVRQRRRPGSRPEARLSVKSCTKCQHSPSHAEHKVEARYAEKPCK